MKIYTIVFVIVLVSIFNISYSQYSSPESITYDSLGKRYLISNTSSSKIVQRDLNGIVTDFVTVGGGIHGVTVHNNKVFVCNGSRVRGYDLSTAVEVFNVVLTGSAFLNDIAIDNSGIAYISDFTSRRIYKLNTNNSGFWIYVANTTNTPNGVYVDASRNRLLVCCWGGSAPVKSVSFTDSSIVNLITTPYSNCDGISLDKFNNVYISTWGIQSVVRYNINFTDAPVIVASSLTNPADIYVNKFTDTLAIPNAGSNTVSFVTLQYPVSINNVNNEIPESIELFQNFPNPFNPVTRIQFDIPSDVKHQTSNVKLIVYNTLGKKVETLVNEKLLAGSYEVEFDGSNFSSGVYFYKLVTGGFIQTKSMILLK
ncbi:MAG: T9SS type A sorting domain-containing protein [Bacteroidota bacterium]|nr:T9SS type A sorting domain-containing protein [Bacteroidota bacterium]